MTIEAPGVPAFGSKIHNFCTLLRGEESCQLDTLSVVVGYTTIAHLSQNILCLYMHFPLDNILSKQEHKMRHGMRKRKKLKVRY